MNTEEKQEVSNVELQDFDDAAETLSLCDLPLTTSASHHWEADFSKEYQSFDDDQDFIGFFSEDFSASTYGADNIMFCGKLIPHKGEEREKDQDIITKTRSKKKGIFPWLSLSFRNSRTPPSKQLQGRSYEALSAYDHRSGFSVKQESVLATPLKSRWYLFSFGMRRLPVEMKLSDIKMRQNKKGSEKMRQSKKKKWSNPTNAIVKASVGCIPGLL